MQTQLFDAPKPKGIEFNEDGFSIQGCNIIYAPKGQAGEYSRLATNPYRGCGHKCAYCVTGDTLILMANGGTKNMKDICVGDQIVGIIREDRNGGAWSHRYTLTEVLAKIKTSKPAYRITLENSIAVTCSSDHRWLTDRGWKYTDGAMCGTNQRPYLTVNNQIRGLGQVTETPIITDDYRLGYLSGMIRGDALLKHYPRLSSQYHFRLALKDFDALDRSADYLCYFGVETHRGNFGNNDNSSRASMQMIRNSSRYAYETINRLIETRYTPEWQRGWLAGIFDAEGSFSGSLRITNGNPEIIAVTIAALDTYAFGHVHERWDNHVGAIRITGGLSENSRFFQVVSPSIARKFSIEGAAVTANFQIAEIKPLNQEIEMFDIMTGTENFIANGLISHNCYVPDILRMKRAEFDAGAIPRPDFLKLLTKDARKYQAMGSKEQVMLSFTTDPFNPMDRSLTRPTIEIIKQHGMAFCTLTKGGSRALEYADLFRPDQDAFATTLTSLDDQFSLKWERAAALPGDRIATLKNFHERGLFTWVSLEPVLDVEATLKIIEATHDFIDFYKIGRVNYIGLTKTTDWAAFTHRVIDLCARLNVQHYIKKDLWPHLPAGYPNRKPLVQHR